MSQPQHRDTVDLLRWPVVGRLLRWRHARVALQIGLLMAAVAIVLHGLLGPQLAPANLATVLTWVHYRGLLVVALLAAGNFFCTGCPFVLVRDAGRRAHAPARRWPRVLRTKWIGIALFAAVLFSYELFDLWSLPRGTAYLVLGYFGAALAVDLTFSGASFCKYLCPVGQFNFVASTVSPLELRVRDLGTCRTCRTADCIKGRRAPGRPREVSQRGCELGLFLPLKVGNMDCTFCLDCVQACPHDNIALAPRLPGAELEDSRRRSGIGRLAQRPDLAALAVLFTFGALVNAFAMVAPFGRIEQTLSSLFGGSPEAPILALLFVVLLGVVPATVVFGAAALTRRLVSERAAPIGRTVARYAYALVPLGVGVWIAHYGFHLLTGLLVVVPVTQSAVIDALGWAALGEPLWGWTGLGPGTVFPIQVGFVLLGTMGSLAVAARISERDYPARSTAATLPWAATAMALGAAALWILVQPMAMRGVVG
jgi:ferredoxin